MESYLKNEVELDGDGLKHLAEKESLLIDVLKSIGIIKLKDRVFVMSQIGSRNWKIWRCVGLIEIKLVVFLVKHFVI